MFLVFHRFPEFDFRFHIDGATAKPATKFIGLMESINFTQHVSGNNHNNRHVLDLVFILGFNDASLYSQDIFISDHMWILFNLFTELKPVIGPLVLLIW